MDEVEPRGTPCFASGSERAKSPSRIELKLAANHRSGVAPFAVFFDTAGTTAPGTDRPFHDLSYCWDFGDSTSGAFATTGLSKNAAQGPVAGHVFETAGTYVVTTSARDREGHVATRAVRIDVLDPDVIYAGAATVCFSNQTAFDGCPTGALEVVTRDLAALTPHLGPGKRLLLRRGDTFAVETLNVNTRGPSVIGAFGEGARPRIWPSGTAFRFSDQTPDLSDWTLMDLDIDGRSNERAGGVLIDGRAKNVLILRVAARKLGQAFSAPLEVIDYYNSHGHPGHDVVDGLSIVDCDARDLVGPDVLSYIAAHRLLMLGNRYYDSTSGEHVLRTPWIDRGVLSNNQLARAPAGRHVIKMHAPHFLRAGVGAGKYTERVVLSDNRIESSGGHSWTVAIGPQNAESDERVRDVIVERNRFLPGDGAARVALTLFAEDVSVRDNVFDRGQQPICVGIGRRGIEPAPTRIELRKNTCISSSPSSPELVELEADVGQVSIFDNLMVGQSRGKAALPKERAGIQQRNNVLIPRSEYTNEKEARRGTVSQPEVGAIGAVSAK